MIILPAIDLIDKHAVRLMQGDYGKKTVYSDKPSDVAISFEKAGAKYIHLVDLDGAKAGEPKNEDVIKSIISNTSLKAEVGGGIRTLSTIEKYLSMGVYRVILGTAAVENEELLKQAVKEFKNGVAIGVDVLNGVLAVKGWTVSSGIKIDDFMKKLDDLGVDNVICTDISKDGAMSGTNLKMYEELKNKYSVKITASGGVSSINDVKALKTIDVYGAILGRALYNGGINLSETIKITNE